MSQGSVGAEHVLQSTFTEIHHELSRSLFRLLRNWEDAQDAAQTAFLKCWKARTNLDTVRDPRAWLFRAGWNAALDLRRKRAARQAVPVDAFGGNLPDSDESAADEVLHRERLERLRAALVELPATEREVFLLRQRTGRTYEEIAQQLGEPVGTMKTRMRSALRKLRGQLAESAAA
jgi:RNA polymerase sigma-70 factor, ECF subfamily